MNYNSTDHDGLSFSLVAPTMDMLCHAIERLKAGLGGGRQIVPTSFTEEPGRFELVAVIKPRLLH